MAIFHLHWCNDTQFKKKKNVHLLNQDRLFVPDEQYQNLLQLKGWELQREASSDIIKLYTKKKKKKRFIPSINQNLYSLPLNKTEQWQNCKSLKIK